MVFDFDGFGRLFFCREVKDLCNKEKDNIKAWYIIITSH